jgi:hypothetical protein
MAPPVTPGNPISTSDSGAEFGTNIPAIMKALLLLPGDPINTPALQVKVAIKAMVEHCRSLAKERDNNLSDLKFLGDVQLRVVRDIK